jgi:site-specific DNA-methyltransferase (adenine-specific)
MSGIFDMVGFKPGEPVGALLFKQPIIEHLRDLEDACVDLVVTDPPYDSLEKHRSKGTTTRLKQSKASSNVWFDTLPDEVFPCIFKELYRVLKANTHLYVFCDHNKVQHLVSCGLAAGFRYWKPLVWDKMRIGMGYHYRCQHEFILFFEKGKRRLVNLATPDVLRYARVYNGYPTEKPVPLLQVLIRQSSSPGEVVLDPFFGSGSCALAALLLGRYFVGTDTAAYAHEYVDDRLVKGEGYASHSVCNATRYWMPL